MTAIPPDEVTMQDVFTWYEMQDQLGKLKAAESLLRKRIVKHFFPTPREGTNSHDLDAGWVMKADCPTDRKVNEAVLTTLTPELKKAKVKVDKLIKWEPKLAVREYRTLEKDETEEGKARLNLFDQCLIIKPGSPQLEIVLPASAKVAVEVPTIR